MASALYGFACWTLLLRCLREYLRIIKLDQEWLAAHLLPASMQTLDTHLPSTCGGCRKRTRWHEQASPDHALLPQPPGCTLTVRPQLHHGLASQLTAPHSEHLPLLRWHHEPLAPRPPRACFRSSATTTCSG